MNIRFHTLKTIISHDLTYAFRSARGVLFLVFFAVFWLWVFSKFHLINPQWLKNPEGTMLMSWLFDQQTARSLFANRDPSFSVFYLVAMNTAPLFVLFAASDQTANDIGSKYLRFLLPRCHRNEIYLGRFIGCALLVWLAYFVISIIAVLWVSVVNEVNVMSLLSDWLWVYLSLALYVLPFIAMMSLCSALVGSAGLSALLGIGFYFIITVIVSVIGFQSESMSDVVSYILPNASKPWLLILDLPNWLKALVMNAIYVLIYGWAGWVLFSRRDI
ncbi:ABC transporter permease [Marinicella rhabdoformis]|uniref:ABC transporter permease n=1 Tax=Marinicella rhabdoformis TaxID=2580566 RepID=UPI0012AEB589|nr:ABC transporter permease subunit [Marinicella rhabdoformis]